MEIPRELLPTLQIALPIGLMVYLAGASVAYPLLPLAEELKGIRKALEDVERQLREVNGHLFKSL